MKINELEKRFGIKRANIRFYESEGLLSPERSENGYRDYSEEDAALLKKIIVYRRLGISIPDIKKVLAGDISLLEASERSISEMTDKLDNVSKTIDLFAELKDNNVTDGSFDTDYYWERLNSEDNGDTALDFINVDVSGFKNQNNARALVLIFSVLFILGIACSFVCHEAFVVNDNDEYTKIIPEVKTSDTIDTVKINTETDRIYVFYEEACAVNTYDLNGNFLWAVSTPNRRDRGMPYFYADDEKLVLDYINDCYFYNAIDGSYIKILPVDEAGYLDEREHWQELHDEDVKTANALGYGFDLYNVYKIDKDKSPKSYIVKKPFFIFLVNDKTGWLIAAIGAAGIIIMIVLNNYKRLKRIQLIEGEVGKAAKIHRIVIAAAIGLTVGFMLLNLILAFSGTAYIGLGVFPLSLLFVIILILNNHMKKRYNQSELKTTGVMLHYFVIAFTAMLISVILSLIAQ